MDIWVNLVYIASSVMFVLGIKMLSAAETAVRGNLVSATGMALAVAVVLVDRSLRPEDFNFVVPLLFMGLGAVVGVAAARLVQLTSIPEMVALFNGFGGGASLLVGGESFISSGAAAGISGLASGLAVAIGAITFSGSIIAFCKLAEWMRGAPVLYPGRQAVILLLVLGALAGVAAMGMGLGGGMAPQVADSMAAGAPAGLPLDPLQVFLIVAAISLLLGIALVLPIGGADMPVVISLLNSYSGLAACAAGFVLGNNLLIVAGSMVGASGIILTNVMCKAMNRSLANVLFGGFGAVAAGGGASGAEQGEARSASVGDAWHVLEAARSVVVVPGYGLAVAQAQHAVRELGDLLKDNGAEVRYAIHPVAGRMPGHMNVLLAEANVVYEDLVEPQDVNPVMEAVDVCLVIGANDVVNPDARESPGSPIYGMPIIEVDRARNVYVFKRSMAAGFAGVQNSLFFRPNTRMLFGDAKESLTSLVAEFKS